MAGEAAVIALNVSDADHRVVLDVDSIGWEIGKGISNALSNEHLQVSSDGLCFDLSARGGVLLFAPQ